MALLGRIYVRGCFLHCCLGDIYPLLGSHCWSGKGLPRQQESDVQWFRICNASPACINKVLTLFSTSTLLASGTGAGKFNQA